MKKINFLNYILCSFLTCLAISLMLYVSSLSTNNKDEIKFKSVPEGFAVMIFDENTQDYIESDIIPIGAYELNIEKSYCTNGGIINNYDYKTGHVDYTIIGTDECIIYLDAPDNENPKIKNVETSDKNITATLTDDYNLSGYALTSSTEMPTSWTPIEGTAYNYSGVSTGYGTYYLWVKDKFDKTNYVQIITEKLYYYAFGKPTTSSTTDYTTLGKNVFVRVDSTVDSSYPKYEMCVVENDELKCGGNGSIPALEGQTCSSGTSGGSCIGTNFSCGINPAGIYCNEKSTGNRCNISGLTITCS